MDDRLEHFIRHHPDAAMITLRADGTPHAARVELGVVDGQILTSGAPSLVRTRNLRRDARCTLFVFAAPPDPTWVGLETQVTVLDGPDSPDLHVQLMRARHADTPEGMVIGHDDVLGHDRPFPEAEYLEHVRAEERLIYRFDLQRTYGNF